MFAHVNSAVNVLRKDGLASLSVVQSPKTLFGFAAKTACPPKKCVNFQLKTFYNLLEKDSFFLEVDILFLGVSIVVDSFPAFLSMITNNIYPCVKKNGSQWSKMIEICNTPDFYSKVLKETFLDGNYSYGRIYVLTLFTENLCRKHPEMADKIKVIYLTFLTQIRVD